MKSTLFIFTTLLFIAFGSQAQELTSKNGIPILPQKGDWALGASATPFLDFVGNATKINSSNAFASPAAIDFLDPSKMYIYGKYFLDDKTAIRAKVRIGTYSRTKIEYSVENGEAWPDLVEDKWDYSSTNLFLAGGIEKRRGYGRLQGFYGAEAMLSVMGGQKNIYTYGNNITKTYRYPDRTDFGSNISGSYYYTELTTKPVLGIGINAFIGVEYFFAPKISLGGEFGWGLGVNQSSGVAGNTESSYEYWDTTDTRVVRESSPVAGKTTSFSIDTRSSGGHIFVMFHF